MKSLCFPRFVCPVFWSPLRKDLLFSPSFQISPIERRSWKVLDKLLNSTSRLYSHRVKFRRLAFVTDWVGIWPSVFVTYCFLSLCLFFIQCSLHYSAICNSMNKAPYKSLHFAGKVLYSLDTHGGMYEFWLLAVRLQRYAYICWSPCRIHVSLKHLQFEWFRTVQV